MKTETGNQASQPNATAPIDPPPFDPATLTRQPISVDTALSVAIAALRGASRELANTAAYLQEALPVNHPVHAARSPARPSEARPATDARSASDARPASDAAS